MLLICYWEIERLFKWFYFYHMHLLRAEHSTQLIEKEVRKKRDLLQEKCSTDEWRW